MNTGSRRAPLAARAEKPTRVEPGRPSNPTRTPEPARVLALGDSYTIGEGVLAEERWPERLVARLTSEGVHVAGPELIARTGWTTDELAAAIDAEAPRGGCALVTLLIGVNDQYQGCDVAHYRPAFRALLERAVALADGVSTRVLALSIPDWSVTPYADGTDRARIAREIDAYNAVCLEEAERGGARYADVTSISRACGAAPEMLAADRLHPSGAQYARWTVAILPHARAAIGAA
jgi:lysophospholipase L1-like esterase